MSTDKPSRREFLSGEIVRQTLREQATIAEQESADEPTSAADHADCPVTEESGYLLHVGRRAMACSWEAYFNAGQYPQATEAALAALELVDQLEAQMTVYRPDSEISCINRAAFVKPVIVEARLYDLLKQAVQLSRDTGGAYDITAGPLSQAWGFSRRAGKIPEQSQLDAALVRVGSRHLDFDDQTRSLRFLQPEVEINLGSIGKGYALDRCRELLHERGVDDFLFHGGSSSVLACGSRQGGDGWTVGLKHPLRPTRRLAEIRLRNRALGTSGAANQFFVHHGQRYGHILDPRTGWPAAGVLSATVVAPTAAAADSLSTAFYVLGASAALEFCRSRPDIAAAIVTPGTHGGRVAIHTCGFTEQDFRLLGEK